MLFKTKNSIELITAIKSLKLSHAVLIYSDEERRQDDLAKIVSCRVVCTSNNKPCFKCKACKKVELGIHPDVIYPEMSGTKLVFSIDEIRKIKAKIHVKPNEADSKIYIFLHAHKMTHSAQNAVLKVLEEPVSDCLFFLFCKSSFDLLETVTSRCSKFFLEKSDFEEIFRVLNYKSHRILRVGTEKFNEDFSEKVFNSILNFDEWELLKLVSQSFENKDNEHLILNKILGFFENILIYKNTDKKQNLENKVQSFSDTVSNSDTIKIIALTNQAITYRKRNIFQSIVATWFCANLYKILSTCRRKVLNN
ncbi:MAG: hypothetical protein LBF33_01830 [Oscillospiraceae bacterium]|nr:hypothetical protein [Oscillospiraceae bacterium]